MSDGKMSDEYLQDIRSVLDDFLREMDIVYPTNITHDYEFEDYCIETAIQYGFSPEFVRSKDFKVALHVGVDIAVATYGEFRFRHRRLDYFILFMYMIGHLDCKVTQQWICFYTATLTYLDDILEHDADMIKDFVQLFITGMPQKHAILDNLADHIRRAYIIFDYTRASLIVSSTLDYLTTLIMDVDQKDMEVWLQLRML